MKYDWSTGKYVRSTTLADTIARWWTWQTEPDSTTILGRIARFLRSEGADHCYDGGLLDRMKLRESLRRNFAKARLTDEKV